MPSLVAEPIVRELGEYIFSQSVPGKLISSALNLPFGAKLQSISGKGSKWLKEAEEIPVKEGEVNESALKLCKLGAIVMLNNELIKFSTPGTNSAIRDLITSESVKEIDKKFLSSDQEVAGVSPEGVLNGADEAENFIELFKKHIANGNTLATSSLILPVENALQLTDAEFWQIELLRIPVIVSEQADRMMLIDAQKLIINVEATVITPTDEAVIKTESGAVSLFQNDATAFRAITYCGWQKLDKAVTVLAKS
ncbi:phage major capsid protein, partial [Escherichia coli]|nr:phage major capsid protein [Escherichia coli]